MRLTPEEYERGLISWEPPDAKIEVRLETREGPGQDAVVASSVREGSGSIVDAVGGDQGRFELSGPDITQLTRFRWERAVGTSLWPGAPFTAPTRVRHIPDFGIFHRIVTDAGSCDWPADAVLRVGSSVIRLITGDVDGERAAPMDQVEVEDDSVSITGEASGSSTATGRFIEVVGHGKSAEQAEEHAWALIGLAGLILGPTAIASVVFSEGYSAEPGRFSGTLAIPTPARFPHVSDEDAPTMLDNALGTVGLTGRTSRAIRLALRWYRKGLMADIEEDELFSYFIGIESLANAFCAEFGQPPSEARRREEVESIDKELRTALGERAGLAKQRLTASTLNERFEHYAKSKGLTDEQVRTFRRLSRARNDAFHGSPTFIGSELVSQAATILVACLKNELGVSANLAWEKTPRIRGFRISYDYRADATGRQHDPGEAPG